MHLPLFPALIFGLLQHINNLSLPETSVQMIPCKPAQEINLVTYIKLTVTVAYFVRHKRASKILRMYTAVGNVNVTLH